MDPGAISISLTAKELGTSRAFYEKLVFQVTGGDVAQDYLILANGECIIGLFHEMFDKNILTFNPGLANKKESLETFTDVREIQRLLKGRGLRPEREADHGTNGAASLVLTDPDGNPILIDQFF